jgi:hypothetical protein
MCLCFFGWVRNKVIHGTQRALRSKRLCNTVHTTAKCLEGGGVNTFLKAGINANYILIKTILSHGHHIPSPVHIPISYQLLLFGEITAISNLQGSDDDI